MTEPPGPTRPFSFAPIGKVRTDVPDADIPRRRRELVSRVEIDPRYVDGLVGIEAYSQIIVLFWMDRTPESDTLLVQPRGERTIDPVGVFAQRGRNRPNPIGLAVVDLIDCRDGVLTVRRLDAYDGTPVIDLKPYDSYDVFPNPRMPAWLAARVAGRGEA